MTREHTQDTKFTKGTLLGMIGAMLFVMYFVPAILLILGATMILTGLVLIALSIYRFRRRYRAYPA